MVQKLMSTVWISILSRVYRKLSLAATNLGQRRISRCSEVKSIRRYYYGRHNNNNDNNIQGNPRPCIILFIKTPLVSACNIITIIIIILIHIIITMMIINYYCGRYVPTCARVTEGWKKCIFTVTRVLL